MKSFTIGEIDRCLSSTRYTKEVTYFVRDGNDGLIKIGKSEVGSLEYRIQALQTGNPRPLLIVGIIIGNVEKELHRKFKRYKVSGEWFRAGPNLVAYIAEHREKIPEQPQWKRGWR